MLLIVLELFVVCVASLPVGLYAADFLGCDALAGKMLVLCLPFAYFAIRFNGKAYSNLLKDGFKSLD